MKHIVSDGISDASSQLLPEIRRRWVALVPLSLVLLATIFAGCGGGQAPADHTPQLATPATVDAQPPPVAFPKHDYPLGTDRGGDYFAGQLVLKEGCLLVEVPSDPTARGASLLAIWPRSFSLDANSGTLRVVDGRGQVAAGVGDYIRLSTAELTYEEANRGELVTGMPEHCPPGRIFVGRDVTAFDPRDEVTELRLSDPEVLLLRQETVMSAQRVFMAAAGVGELILDGPCLRIKGGYNTNTVVWPAGFTPHVEGGAVHIRNGAGQTIARVGDEIAGGGGYFKSNHGECPGEMFRIHDIKVLPDVEVYFPRWDDGIRKGQVTLSRTGELALDGKCLVLENILDGGVPHNALLFWPKDYALNVEDGVVEVLDATGRVAARVGDVVQANVFTVTYGQATKHGGLEEITPACSGAYWAVEEILAATKTP